MLEIKLGAQQWNKLSTVLNESPSQSCFSLEHKVRSEPPHLRTINNITQKDVDISGAEFQHLSTFLFVQ